MQAPIHRMPCPLILFRADIVYAWALAEEWGAHRVLDDFVKTAKACGWSWLQFDWHGR